MSETPFAPSYFVAIPGQRIAARITMTAEGPTFSGAISHPDYRGDPLLRAMRPSQVLSQAYERLAVAFKVEALQFTPEGEPTALDLERRANEALDPRALDDARKLAELAYEYVRQSRSLWEKACTFAKAMLALNLDGATRAATAKTENDKLAADVQAAALTVNPSIASGVRKPRS